MSADPICVTCGKKVRAGRSGSLTQWLFTEDSCECGGKVRSLKLSEDELSTATDGSRMCSICGKLRSESRQGSLTQWVFGAERCRCDYEKLQPGDLFAGSELEEDGEEIVAFSSELDPEQIDILELGEIDYHGLSPNAFPFERYRIISEKGRGNAGIVYEAWDCSLRKRVAIKTMFNYQWSADEVVRFQSEARNSSRLNHPNVLQILDFGASVSGQPYMVMEYVDGTTLKELVDELGGIETEEALPLFLQICNGLGHAHREGILHRDVKCSNVMIGKDRNGERILKVIDFGIASFSQGQQAMTKSGNQAITIVGSPLYMSPDQMHGLVFDARSEVYSVGCVMFETLTGGVPFDGESVMATMNMHATAEMPELRRLDGKPIESPPRLYDAIKKCLEKNPDDRFQAIEELHDCLLDIHEKYAHERIEAKIALEAVEHEKLEKRKRVVLAAKSVATVVLVVCVVSVIGISVYKLISAVPTPVVVPTHTMVEIYDKDTEDVSSKSPSEMFEDLKSDSLSIRYLPVPRRLVIDGTANGDRIIERLLKSKLVVRDLEMFNISLSPQAFEKVSQVKGLEELTLTEVDYPKDFVWLKKLTNIRLLKFSGVEADVQFFQSISTLKKLVYLDIEESKIDADGLALLRPLSLQRLSVRASPLTDAHVEEIAKFKTLKTLFVGDTGISDSNVRQLANLNLQGVGLVGLPITDDTLVYLGKKMPNLIAIYIFRCNKLSPSAIQRFRTVNRNVSVMDDQSDELKSGFTPVE